MKIRAIPLIAAVSLICLSAPAHAKKFPPGLGGACSVIDTTITPITIYDIQFGLGACKPGAACVFPSSVGCDSVYGVTGIVTGIKNNGTSRTFYMQSRRSDLSYTGIDVFNGNGLFNTSIMIGDSVSVSGKVEEGFAKSLVAGSGETEISGFDGSSATITDLPTNILSPGNPLPPFHTLTVADIRFPTVAWNSTTPNGTLATGEPWESGLVRVVGPLVVGLRAYDSAVLDTAGAHETWPSYPGIETRSPSGGGFLCYPQGSPGDSIYIDMTSFVTMRPPAVGTVVDSVFGILQQGGRSGAGGIVSWRIAPRSAAPGYSNSFTPDLYLQSPPEIAEAYAIANDSVKIVFDQGVKHNPSDGDAYTDLVNPANYSFTTSGRPVDFVHPIGGNAVVVHPTTPGTVGDEDVVTAVNFTGLTNNVTQTAVQAQPFVNGILTIAQIQAPDVPYLTAGTPEDRSKFAGALATNGTRLTLIGVCTNTMFTRERYLQDPALLITDITPPRSGIKVFQPSSVVNGNGGSIPNAMTVGRKYLVSGPVTEFLGETELNAPPYVEDLGVGIVPLPFTSPNVTVVKMEDFITIDTSPGGIGSEGSVVTGEDYEGCLVQFSHNLRTMADAGPAGPTGFFHAANASNLGPYGAVYPDPDQIEVDFTRMSGHDPVANEYFTLKGVLAYRFSQGDVFPRFNADVTYLGLADVTNDPLPAEVSFSAHPNPALVTELNFALPRRGQVDLAVFDVRGRRLATIASGSFPAGRYIRKWDGRTDKGSTTGSGVYFYRLKVGQEVFNLRGVRIN